MAKKFPRGFGSGPNIIIRKTPAEQKQYEFEMALASKVHSSIEFAEAQGVFTGLNPQQIWDKIIHYASENARGILITFDQAQVDGGDVQILDMALTAYLKKLKSKMLSKDAGSFTKKSSGLVDRYGKDIPKVGGDEPES